VSDRGNLTVGMPKASKKVRAKAGRATKNPEPAHDDSGETRAARRARERSELKLAVKGGSPELTSTVLAGLTLRPGLARELEQAEWLIKMQECNQAMMFAPVDVALRLLQEAADLPHSREAEGYRMECLGNVRTQQGSVEQAVMCFTEVLNIAMELRLDTLNPEGQRQKVKDLEFHGLTSMERLRTTRLLDGEGILARKGVDMVIGGMMRWNARDVLLDYLPTKGNTAPALAGQVSLQGMGSRPNVPISSGRDSARRKGGADTILEERTLLQHELRALATIDQLMAEGKVHEQDVTGLRKLMHVGEYPLAAVINRLLRDHVKELPTEADTVELIHGETSILTKLVRGTGMIALTQVCREPTQLGRCMYSIACAYVRKLTAMAAVRWACFRKPRCWGAQQMLSRWKQCLAGAKMTEMPSRCSPRSLLATQMPLESWQNGSKVSRQETTRWNRHRGSVTPRNV
jgi:hypothetical protein